MIVLIDNGHGLNTPGKRSPDSRILEYSYTRQIAHSLCRELKMEGICSQLVTPELTDVSLKVRTRRINDICDIYGKDNVMAISIHLNASGDGSSWMSAQGWSAYTSIGQTRADAIAEQLYAAAEKYLHSRRIRKDLSDGDSDFEENFYLLSLTICPVVLSENLFQDNLSDAEYLLSDEGKSAIVGLHKEAIITYISKL